MFRSKYADSLRKIGGKISDTTPSHMLRVVLRFLQ
jgi:hypothetical protein